MVDLNPQEKSYYNYLWSIADSDKDGKMTAGDAVQFFRKANLPDQVLGVIWGFSDNPPKGFLNETEFYTALRLIAVAQSGKEITSRDAGNNIGTLANFPAYPNPSASPVQTHQTPSSSDSQWVITPSDRQKFTEYFKATDTDKDGFITGNEAFHLFSKSGLEMTDLAKIWKLSDITQDTKLDCEEFIIAMFLITAKRKGAAIPDTLPPSLLPGPSIFPTPLIFSGSSTSAPSSPAPPPHSPAVTHNKQISDEDKAKYTEIFKRSDPTNSKFVSGEQARQIFGRSGLNVNDLAKIWTLSDIDRDGKLNEPEFVIAMWLIYGKLKGMEIPDSISDSLKAEVGLVTAAPASPTMTVAVLPSTKKTGNYDISLDDLASPPPPPQEVHPPTPVPADPLSITPTPTPVTPPTTSAGFGPDDGFGSFATFTAFNSSNVSLPTMSSGASTPTQNLSTASLPQYSNTMSGNAQYPANTMSGNAQYSNTMSGNAQYSATGSAQYSGTTTPTHNLSTASLPQYSNTMSGNVGSGSSTPTHNLSTASLPQYANTMSGNAYVNPAKKEEVNRQYLEERTANAELENQVNQEQRALDALTAEFKELEIKLNEERTTSVALKEKLKYIRMQIKTIKEQKEQYEKILLEKNEQLKEEEELYQLLASELQEKKNEVARIQTSIDSVTMETDAIRLKKREAREELTAIKSSPVPVHNVPANTSAPASPVVAKKDPPPVPKKSPTQAAPSFGFGTDDFSSVAFDAPSSFGPPATETTPTPEPVATTPTTTAEPAQPSFSASFDTFGSDSFGSSSFDFGSSQPPAKVSPAVPPKPPAKKPVEEDPFAFTSDLSASSVNDAPDDFGSSAFGSSSATSSSGFDTFGSHTGFGDSNFSFDSFGTTPATTTAPPVPVKPAAVSAQPSFDSSFDFPSNLAEFDTGKDSFG